MSTVEERLNNAISTLGQAVRNSGVATPYNGFEDHLRAIEYQWEEFWRSDLRAATPTPLLLPKLRKFVRWYAALWINVGAKGRGNAPAPDQIDPSLSDAASDTLRAWREGAQDVAKPIAEGVRLGTEKLLVWGAVIGLAWWYFSSKKGGR